MRLLLPLLLVPVCLAQSVATFDFDPPIVPVGTASVVLTVKIIGAPQRVTFEPSWATASDIDLTASGNGVYTITIPLQQLVIQPDDVFRPFLGYLALFTPAGASKVNLFLPITAPNIPKMPVTNDGPAMRHTAYVVNMLMPEAFPLPNAANPSLLPDYKPVLQRFYQTFPDDFDVMNIAWVSPSFVLNRDHGIIKNTVKGIGVDLLDNSASHGSSRGTLTGVSRFPSQAFFDGAETGMHHEFGHQFINHMNFAPVGDAIPHWPFSTMATGVMGFSILPTREGGGFHCKLVPEAGGVRVVPNNVAPVFSNMDLYLMGLIPASAVGDNYILNDQSKFPACDSSLTSAVSKLTGNDVASLLGPRIPDVASSKKQYRLTTILLTRDKLLDDNAMNFYSYFARRAEETGQVPSHIGFTKESANPFVVSTQGKATWSLQLIPTTLPQIGYGGVIDGASGAALVGQGSYASAYGTGLASTTLGAATFPLQPGLGGTTVLVNGRLAPVYFVSPLQVNFQVPFETEPGPGTVSITSNGLPTSIAWIQVAAAAPGILIYGNNRAVAQNQDFSLNTQANPAAQGTFLTVYLTGIGPLDNPVANGQAAPNTPLSRAKLPYSAAIGNQLANITFLGLTPGFVGLAQANIQAPNLANGDYLVTVRVGSQSSNAAFVSIGK